MGRNHVTWGQRELWWGGGGRPKHGCGRCEESLGLCVARYQVSPVLVLLRHMIHYYWHPELKRFTAILSLCSYKYKGSCYLRTVSLKRCGENEVKLYIFLISAREGERSAPCSGHFITGKKSAVPIGREAGWAHGIGLETRIYRPIDACTVFRQLTTWVTVGWCMTPRFLHC